MLLTRDSVVPGWLPTTHRVPGRPGGITDPIGPFIHSIRQFSQRTLGYHYQSRTVASWRPLHSIQAGGASSCHCTCQVFTLRTAAPVLPPRIGCAGRRIL